MISKMSFVPCHHRENTAHQHEMHVVSEPETTSVIMFEFCPNFRRMEIWEINIVNATDKFKAEVLLRLDNSLGFVQRHGSTVVEELKPELKAVAV